MDNKSATQPEPTNEQLERLVEQQARGEMPDLDVRLTDLDELEDGELDDRRSKLAVQTCDRGIVPCQG